MPVFKGRAKKLELLDVVRPAGNADGNPTNVGSEPGNSLGGPSGGPSEHGGGDGKLALGDGGASDGTNTPAERPAVEVRPLETVPEVPKVPKKAPARPRAVTSPRPAPSAATSAPVGRSYFQRRA